MLARKDLVDLRKEFPRIRKEGKIYDSPAFGLVVAFGPTSQELRGVQAAFIISKKIDRRSVVRHEVKRKLSDAVSPLLPRLAKNVKLVFLAKQKAIVVTKEEVKLELETVLKRARLL